MNKHLQHAAWTHDLATLSVQIPLKLIPWLTEKGSLTQFAQGFSTSVRPIVLKNEHDEVWQTEITQLSNIDANKTSWIREIHMLGEASECWWFARTVIPHKTIENQGHVLSVLGEQPLGLFLFQQPDLVRSTFEYAVLQPNDLEFQYAIQHQNLAELPERLFTRRSTFYFHNDSLLVTEIFLPPLLEFLEKN